MSEPVITADTNEGEARPPHGHRAALRHWISGNAFQCTIITLIVVNAITLGLETTSLMQDPLYARILISMDQLILYIFTIEVALRIYAWGARRFFSDPWSLFDFVIVVMSLMPAQGALSVLRSLRILRTLRLISVLPTFRSLVQALGAAMPGMGSIMGLMLLVFYVASVMATKLYMQSFPEWFGSIPRSAYSLFQIMTLESWSMGIVRPVMEAHPYAWMFFVPFILISSFMMLNLFVAVMVTAMDHLHKDDPPDQRHASQLDVLELKAEVARLSALIEAQSRAQAEAASASSDKVE